MKIQNSIKMNEVEKLILISGKTYFFAESNIGLLMFYHNHHQSYGFEKVAEEKRQEFLNERESWVNAPFAKEVGQTDNKDLFVC